MNSPYTAVMIVPTGIGAKIGGFAGDALPSAKLLASVVDVLVTHPNVMNGAMLYSTVPNILYVEGYALDSFASGEVGLLPLTKKQHSIGLLIDRNVEDDLVIRHLQVADAMRATLGIDIQECVITECPIGVTLKGVSNGGGSWGSVRNVTTLLEGARELINKRCTSIAVVARFPEDEEEEAFQIYRQGLGLDPIAGVEAIISHIITKNMMVPCAHAPAYSPMNVDPIVSPKACAEEIGYTFLPCILSYLSKAPYLIPLSTKSKSMLNMSHNDVHDAISNPNINQEHINKKFCISKEEITQRSTQGMLTAADVDAVVVPVNALGGQACLEFIAQGKLIICVEENETNMRVSAKDLFGEELQQLNSQTNVQNEDKNRNSKSIFDHVKPNIVTVRNYAEAAGILVAHKEGILFESITSSVSTIRVTKL